MAYPQKPCKHESDPFLELHERGAKLILLNLDKSPARGFVAATPADIQSHTGDFGIFPISAKTICIDVDEGDPQTILDINARYRGARVIGVDSNPYRIQKAKELGAAATSRSIALARRRRIVCALMPLDARGRLLLWVNAATTPSYALAPI